MSGAKSWGWVQKNIGALRIASILRKKAVSFPKEDASYYACTQSINGVCKAFVRLATGDNIIENNHTEARDSC